MNALQKKQTPLHLAAIAGMQAACDTLINLGASVDSTDDFGQKPVSTSSSFPLVKSSPSEKSAVRAHACVICDHAWINFLSWARR